MFRQERSCLNGSGKVQKHGVLFIGEGDWLGKKKHFPSTLQQSLLSGLDQLACALHSGMDTSHVDGLLGMLQKNNCQIKAEDCLAFDL